jgi:hypothetical protein
LTVNLLRNMTLMIFAMTAVANAYGQQGQWAAADNPTAKFMIDAERQWAEAACTHNKIAEKILAEDFQDSELMKRVSFTAGYSVPDAGIW